MDKIELESIKRYLLNYKRNSTNTECDRAIIEGIGDLVCSYEILLSATLFYARRCNWITNKKYGEPMRGIIYEDLYTNRHKGKIGGKEARKALSLIEHMDDDNLYWL